MSDHQHGRAPWISQDGMVSAAAIVRVDSDTLLPRRSVDYRAWFWNVFCWDGLLPLCIVAVPRLTLLLFQNRGPTEFVSVVLPIVAFLIRIPVGGRRIRLNHCNIAMKCAQFIVFGCAALSLVCIDALLILSLVMPRGALWQTETDRILWVVVVSVYLLAMTFAMYPGKTEAIGSERSDEFDESCARIDMI